MADPAKPIVAIEKSLDSWATITIDNFQANLVKYGFGELDGALMRSFTKEVKAASGDAWKVLIKFLKYGRFGDMNVGRGHPIGKPGNRRPAPWYSKQKTKEISILRFIMAKNFSMLSVRQLETELKSINKTSS